MNPTKPYDSYIKKERIAVNSPLFEFHVSRNARRRYNFDQMLFAQTGNVIFTDFYRVRIFAEKMNKQRDLVSSPELTIKAGSLNAMGLIDEILHHVVGLFKEQIQKDVFEKAENFIRKEIGDKDYNDLLHSFVETFPPLAVYLNEKDSKTYLNRKTAGTHNRQIVLEEILMLYLANQNPAFSFFKELFDDQELSKQTAYIQFLELLEDFFSEQEPFGPDQQNLIHMLAAPAKKFPNSLTDQLEYIRTHWGYLLSKYIYRLFSSLDLIKEEEKSIFGGPGPSFVPDFAHLRDEEYERFSTDLDWMPRVVMLAKSTFVWLDQLSKKYKKNISTLDQIPDEELDIIADRGFTALWFIGLWERSPASRKIKQISGNPEAVSSAYSLYDYTIARDLGGDAAYENLRKRAWDRGIRLASDMVPNHTGIYSKWMVEHPDWFVQADHPVFPGYTFNGPNLSEDDRVAIYIEDGYWNRSDAAVLFKRVDMHTGSVKYVYHGNDGTSMPWNDTAQLNYLIPEVREAVIQTILHVARQFPIIRLDAAMTLAKRHFQRLWFPQPGTGGDIPSRAEFGLDNDEFNRLFPVEFWREVVDRVAQEVPDTLLLAEAFWMMEGYFVRTLGMHRVYNSAFMNMLKNEENKKYRQAIKNVMEFNPEIMKRYVNFINNPDEETAVAQFGKNDKYFGVCILMSTLPGLPMFGHGQVEGFSEKYGMEYQKAYWNETEDSHLVERHYREIFPILKKRYLFSEVLNFILYDLIGPDGYVNENVYAFSNRSGQEKALVLFNNRYERSAGWIKYSSASAQKSGDYFKQYTLSEGLVLSDSDTRYTIFRDQISNLEYIRSSAELSHHGLYVELDGFKYHVFLDFREIRDNEHTHYAQLAQYLGGRGVPSIEEALKETFLTPIHEPFNQLVETGFLNKIRNAYDSSDIDEKLINQYSNQIKKHYKIFLERIGEYTDSKDETEPLVDLLVYRFNCLLHLNDPAKYFETKKTAQIKNILTFLQSNHTSVTTLFLWAVISDIGRMQDENYASVISLSWIDEFLLNKFILQALQKSGFDEYAADRQLLLIKILTLLPDWLEQVEENPAPAFQSFFQYQEVQKFLGANQYQNVLYFHFESLVEILSAYLSINMITHKTDTSRTELKKTIGRQYKLIESMIDIARQNSCRLNDTIDSLKTQGKKKK